MSMAAKPWMMFYPQDWRADESLRLCSLAARGLWVEMLALMHRSERYGYLLVKGKTPTDRQLAALVGATVDEVAGGLAELEEFEVFSRDRNRTIYSRRMIRDEKRSKTAAKNGSKGGNPTLRKETGNSGSLNQQDKAGVEGSNKPQSPESRVKDKDKSLSKKRLTDDWAPEAFGEGSDAAAIVAGWSNDEEARQLAAFRDHHKARDNRFADWQAAWGTWVRNSVKFVRPTGPASAPPNSNALVQQIFAERGLSPQPRAVGGSSR